MSHKPLKFRAIITTILAGICAILLAIGSAWFASGILASANIAQPADPHTSNMPNLVKLYICPEQEGLNVTAIPEKTSGDSRVLSEQFGIPINDSYQPPIVYGTTDERSEVMLPLLPYVQYEISIRQTFKLTPSSESRYVIYNGNCGDDVI